MNVLERATNTGLSLSDVARRVGVTPGYISQVKGGYRPISPDVAADIAEALGEDPVLAAMEVLAANAKTAKARAKWEARIEAYRLAAGVVGRDGFEPSTNWLKANCSTS